MTCSLIFLLLLWGDFACKMGDFSLCRFWGFYMAHYSLASLKNKKGRRSFRTLSPPYSSSQIDD